MTRVSIDSLKPTDEEGWKKFRELFLIIFFTITEKGMNLLVSELADDQEEMRHINVAVYDLSQEILERVYTKRIFPQELVAPMGIAPEEQEGFIKEFFVEWVDALTRLKEPSEEERLLKISQQAEILFPPSSYKN